VPDALYLIPGVIAAGLGGELFVRSTVGGAARARVAPGIVAATVAAFATSSPEMSVAVNAATAGRPEIALGDLLGSNVVNIGLVLAIAILLGGITARGRDLRRDIPPALAAPLLVLALSWDGGLSRGDGIILLLSFAGWFTLTVMQAARERSSVVEVLADRSLGRVLVDGVAGLVLLILAGRLIVLAAADFGRILGWDTFTVGAVLVAVATSVPELATVIAAKLRNHGDVSVGTVLGSNIFNGLLIVGVAATIHPIRVTWNEFLVAIVFGVLTMLMVIPGRSNRLGVWRGVMLLTTYAAYVTTLLVVHRGV
jgi:cation:H+ antiporter